MSLCLANILHVVSSQIFEEKLMSQHFCMLAHVHPSQNWDINIGVHMSIFLYSLMFSTLTLMHKCKS